MSAKRIASVKISWLESFLAVVEHGGVSAAADSLNCNHSTVSRHIKHLEEWLHKILLTLDVPPELTPDGQAFLATAETIVKLMQDSRAKIPAQAEKSKPIDARSIKI